MRLERAALLIAALGGVASLSGCASGLGSPGPRAIDTTPRVDRAALSAAVAASYLQVLERLIQAQPAEQAEILASAEHDYGTAPTPSNELKLALVLAAPGHAGFDAMRAQQLLRDVLATPETLMPAERALAFLTLQNVQSHLNLVAENQRLQSDSERTDRERTAAVAKRLQGESEENARLRKELEDTRAKLDAIANIERSLNSHRPPARDPKKDSPEGSPP